MKLSTTIITLLLLISVSVNAQKTMSLQEAQAFALENAYSNKIAQLDVDKARSKVKETFAIGLPQVNASGSFTHYIDIPVNVVPDFISPTVYGVLVDEDLVPSSNVPEFGTVPAQFGTDYVVNAGVELTQLLFNGSYLIGLQASKVYVEFSQNQLEMNESDIRQAVASAYYGVLVSEENIKILTDNQKTLSNLLIDTRAYYEEGFTEEQDVEQLELNISQIDASIANLEKQAKNMMDLLKIQIGMPIAEEVSLTDNLNSLLQQYEGITLAQRNLESQNHPSFKMAETNMQLQALNLKNQKAQFWPILSAFASHQQSAQRLEFDFFDSGGEWFPSTLWGVNLSIPVFSSGMKKNVVTQARLDYDIATIQKNQVEEGIKMEYNTAYSDFVYAQDRYRIERKNADLAKRIKDKTEIKYQEGISSSFELNQSQNQYIASEGNYIEAVLNFLNAKSALDKATNKYE